MTKKHKKRSEKRAAKRRAARPGGRKTATAKAPRGDFYMMGGPLMTSKRLDAKDIPVMRTYVEAHSLLPDTFSDFGPASLPHVRSAMEIVADPTATPELLLWAIVVLGHTPTEAAFAALERHARSARTHADIAVFAADECADWITSTKLEQSAAVLN